MTDLAAHTSAPPGPDAAAQRWRLSEGFLLRVAGRPADVAAELRTPDAVAWAERVFALEAARDTTGAALRGGLEDAIAGTAREAPHRGALINLRRDVFNARRPRPATLRAAAAALPDTVRALLERWLADLAALAAERGRGEEVLATDLAAARARARVLLDDDALRSAVLLQSEVLEKHMDRYLDPGRKLDKQRRHLERTLLELLYRSALKTSPFSTLTSVGLGCFGPLGPGGSPDQSPGAGLPCPDSLRQRSTAGLNVAVLARLAAVILADAELRADVRVTLAPGASVEGDSVRYVRRRTAAQHDPDAVVALDSVHEDMFFLPSGPALADVVELAEASRPTLRALGRQVAAARPERTVAEAEKLLGHLLRLGFLLAPQLQVDLRAPAPDAVLAEALGAHGHPALRRAATHLTRCGELVRAYPRTTGRGRAGVLARVRDEVRAAFDTVGADAALIPRTLIYEDTTVGGAGLEAALPVWEERYLPDLADLADILPAFDVNVPRRLTATGFFRARYGVGGRCEDVVRFCHEFQRDFFDPYTKRAMRRRSFDEDNRFVRQENWFKIDDISALDDAREAASTHLRSLYSVAGDTEGEGPPPEEIRLGPDFVEAVRRRLPDAGRVRHPWSFFVQLAAERGSGLPGRLVLNQAYAGMTLMFSRFAHSLDAGGADATRLIRHVLGGYARDGAVLAELRGGYETTNLNVHPAVTDYEIVCPGDASTRPAHEQIPLEDLVLVHDAEADRVVLRSRRLRREVVPVYLGFLLPMALPEVQQVLMCFSPSGMAQIDLWAGTGEPVPAEGITAYPRLVLGDLVLQRRMWKLSVSAFPFRDPAHSDAEHLLRVQRWRRAHRLPRRLFVQTDAAAARSAVDDGATDGAEGAAGAGEGDGARKTGRKPLPVDFDSWLSINLLEQLALGASARIVLTEPLPDTDELWLRNEEGRRHVNEFLIELYDGGGPRVR
ncbi:lantibiotic dehydratase [Streptomyces sp. NPDC048172]|uniref:lantibiotic dehydratase n=1 Tax=Streptomyces sp. NPDC048172 TaxID=3365505 RepID=UPI0037223B8F